MKRKMLNFLSKEGRPITSSEIAHALQMSHSSVNGELSFLKTCGVVREVSLEQLLLEGK